MSVGIPEVSSPFRMRGWLLWLTWLYVVIFALGTVFGIIVRLTGAMPFGLEFRGPGEITVWWVLVQVPYIAFGITCVGVLLADRDFAWAAVFSAWAIVAVQFIQAFMQLFHLRLSLPLSAVLYAAYAIGMARLLRADQTRGRTDGGLV